MWEAGIQRCTYLFFNSRSSRLRDASSVTCCGLVIVEPAVAMTTPWGNVVGAIWYCTLPAESEDTGRDTEKASPFWVSPLHSLSHCWIAIKAIKQVTWFTCNNTALLSKDAHRIVKRTWNTTWVAQFWCLLQYFSYSNFHGEEFFVQINDTTTAEDNCHTGMVSSINRYISERKTLSPGLVNDEERTDQNEAYQGWRTVRLVRTARWWRHCPAPVWRCSLWVFVGPGRCHLRGQLSGWPAPALLSNKSYIWHHRIM